VASTKAHEPWRLPQGTGATAWFARLGVRAGRPFWGLLGVERTTLETLVRLLCTIDTRRSNEQQVSWMQSLIAIGAFKSGLFVFVIAWLLRTHVGTDAIYALSFVQTFALCALVVLNFHADALVDGDDLRILGATPVRARTVYASRCVYMGAHAALLASLCAFWPLALGPIITKNAWPLIVVPVVASCALVAAVGFVALSHTLLLMTVGAKRYAGAALVVRTALVCGLLGVLQVLPRRPDWMRAFWEHPLREWLPPTSFLHWGPVLRGEASSAQVQALVLALAGCVVILPVAIALTSRRYLRALHSSEIGSTNAKHNLEDRGWFARVGARLSRSSQERAGFGYASALARREMPFLRQALVMSAATLGGSLLSLVGLQQEGLPQLARGAMAGLVFVAVVAVGIFDVARFTATPQARWIFAAAPLSDLTAVHRGALLGVLVTIWLPLQLTAAVLGLVCFGMELWMHTAVALLGSCVLTLWWAPRFQYYLPFSEPFSWQDNSLRNMLPALAMLASVGVLTVAVGLIYAFVPYGALALLPCALGGLYFAWRRFRSVPGPVAGPSRKSETETPLRAIAKAH